MKCLSCGFYASAECIGALAAPGCILWRRNECIVIVVGAEKDSRCCGGYGYRIPADRHGLVARRKSAWANRCTNTAGTRAPNASRTSSGDTVPRHTAVPSCCRMCANSMSDPRCATILKALPVHRHHDKPRPRKIPSVARPPSGGMHLDQRAHGGRR